jgi:hypothetical protein
MTTQEEEPIEEERRAGADTTAMNAMYGDEQSPETSNNNLSQGMDSILASREQVNGTTAKVTLDKASVDLIVCCDSNRKIDEGNELDAYAG